MSWVTIFNHHSAVVDDLPEYTELKIVIEAVSNYSGNSMYHGTCSATAIRFYGDDNLIYEEEYEPDPLYGYHEVLPWDVRGCLIYGACSTDNHMGNPCWGGITIDNWNLNTESSGVPTPVVPECSVCEGPTISSCWTVLFENTGVTLENGTALDGRTLWLTYRDGSQCTWENQYSCAGTPGDCFTVLYTITEDSLDLSIEGFITSDGGSPNVITQFSLAIEPTIDCEEGEFVLSRVGGSGTATLKAKGDVTCTANSVMYGCVLGYDGETIQPYYSCSGCWISSLVITLTGFTSMTVEPFCIDQPELCPCDGYSLNGAYEIVSTTSPCIYSGTFEVCGSHEITITYMCGYYWNPVTNAPEALTSSDLLLIYWDCPGSLPILYLTIDRTTRGTCTDAMTGTYTSIDWNNYANCPGPPPYQVSLAIAPSGSVSIASGGTCGN
jgi:hypothetical protein